MNLLKGLIQGSMVTAVANALWNGTGSGSASTTFTDMKVAGIPLSNSPPPNTSIPVPGVGYAVLNEQVSNIRSSGASEAVNGFDLYVTQTNSFGLPIGAQIILGYAQASVSSY
jgi:hypothetical protein